jgi:hypothetical protein
MNLAKRNPVAKVIGNTTRKAAICGLIETIPRSTTCLSRIKL